MSCSTTRPSSTSERPCRAWPRLPAGRRRTAQSRWSPRTPGRTTELWSLSGCQGPREPRAAAVLADAGSLLHGHPSLLRVTAGVRRPGVRSLPCPSLRFSVKTSRNANGDPKWQLPGVETRASCYRAVTKLCENCLPLLHTGVTGRWGPPGLCTSLVGTQVPLQLGWAPVPLGDDPWDNREARAGSRSRRVPFPAWCPLEKTHLSHTSHQRRPLLLGHQERLLC